MPIENNQEICYLINKNTVFISGYKGVNAIRCNNIMEIQLELMELTRYGWVCPGSWGGGYSLFR